MLANLKILPVIDFFSGAGGMSYGFHQHKRFKLIAAIDGELSKPSSHDKSSDCNLTYFLNCGIYPQKAIVNKDNIIDLAEKHIQGSSFEGVLIACPPCTDFTRAKPQNHVLDGSRNELTSSVAKLITEKQPKYFVYENAREALQGNHARHLETILHCLESMGYKYKVEIFNLNRFGLPQRRERVILIASRETVVHDLKDLWHGHSLQKSANVQNALQRLSNLESLIPNTIDNRYPKLTADVQSRINAIPLDGGSWMDIALTHNQLLIPSMRKKIQLGKIGSYSDVYGRMALNQPAPTIKRECSHVGNGRYVHPLENRLLTIGEMGFLQGFPIQFKFSGKQLSNCYRQIGDAVPPLISYQIAALISWMESNKKPLPHDFVLPWSSLDVDDILLPTEKEKSYRPTKDKFNKDQSRCTSANSAAPALG